MRAQVQLILLCTEAPLWMEKKYHWSVTTQTLLNQQLFWLTLLYIDRIINNAWYLTIIIILINPTACKRHTSLEQIIRDSITH